MTQQSPSRTDLCYTSAIQKVQMFVKEQLGLGFIKRYLGRETIQEAIKDCDTSLSGAVSMFSVCPVRSLGAGRSSCHLTLHLSGIGAGPSA